jgi:hypothetical protein
MKAEHRKELRTNALADRIGRFIQGVKTRTQANYLMIWGTLAVVVAGFVIWYFINRSNKNARSELWVELDSVAVPASTMPIDKDHDPYKKRVSELEDIIENHKGTKQALIARFELARINLRNLGLDLLADDPRFALANLEKAKREYTKLAEDYKDEPQWAAQARLGLAQIAETRAIQDLSKLDDAVKLYEQVAQEYPKTAAGMEAQQRVKEFKDSKKRAAIEQFYKDLPKQDPKFSVGQ